MQPIELFKRLNDNSHFYCFQVSFLGVEYMSDIFLEYNMQHGCTSESCCMPMLWASVLLS